MSSDDIPGNDWLPIDLRRGVLPGGGPPASLTRLDGVLDGSALLGIELDTRYRVLALTVEPAEERDAWPGRDDRRVQVLCFPVSTVLASLRRRDEDGRTAVLTFEESQLVEVVAALSDPVLRAPLLGQPEPRPGEWGPRYSLEGRSSAPDGTRASLRLAVGDDELDLEVFARFDEVTLKGPDGEDLTLPAQ